MRHLGSVLALVVVLVLTPTLPAAAQSSPFTPLLPPPQAPAPAPVRTPPSSSTDNGGLSAGAKTGLLLAGGLLIAGISWVIVRDARRSAPRRRGAKGGQGDRGPAPKPAAAPGARGRPTGRGGNARKRARKRAKTR